MQYLKIAAVSFLAILSMASCKQKAASQKEAVTYPLLKVSPEDRTLSVSYSAVIEGKQDVEVRPQVSGFITDVLVKEGAKVKKGQTLFVIDTIPYAAAYREAEASVATAEAQLATAELSLEGSEDLYAENVISDFELQTAKNSYNSAVAALRQAEAAKASAAQNLSYAIVKSPVSGSAGMTSVRVGALVSSAMSEPLISVSDNSEMYVYFSLPEKEVLSMTRQYGSIDNTIASFRPVTLILSDGTTYEKEGHIDVISRIVDKGTGTVSIRAVFDNGNGRLMSGSSGRINISYDREGCIVIPQTATYEIQDKIYVYKVEDGKAVSNEIKVFRINDGKEYIVESGLNTGDVIVSEGAGLLREGTPITGTPVEAGSNSNKGE